jgi:hypothetical protein
MNHKDAQIAEELKKLNTDQADLAATEAAETIEVSEINGRKIKSGESHFFYFLTLK